MSPAPTTDATATDATGRLSLWLRAPFKVDVVRDRASLARLVDDGWIENVYTLKIMNKSQHDISYLIEAEGLDGLVYEGKREVKALAGEVLSLPVELSIEPEKLPSSTNEIRFRIQSIDDARIGVVQHRGPVVETDQRHTATRAKVTVGEDSAADINRQVRSVDKCGARFADVLGRAHRGATL